MFELEVKMNLFEIEDNFSTIKVIRNANTLLVGTKMKDEFFTLPH